MTYVIQLAGWIVCGIYATIPAFWLIIHPYADFWRKRYRAPLKVLGLLWVMLWIVAWAVSSPWRNLALPMPSSTAWVTIPCWAVSFFIYFGRQWHFSLGQVIGRNELESERQPQILVTTGLHARIRHPLYLGHLCTMLGWLSLARTEAVLGLFVVGVVSGVFMIRAEDAELERRFGEAYREYKSKVPAVVPKF